MTAKIGVGLFGAILILLTAQGCIFGGDDGGGGSVARPGSIVTATLAATQTDPILLGQSQPATGGTTGGGASGQTYVIQSNDTLGGIATSLGVPADQQAAWIAEVSRLNGISDPRQLAVGAELNLPRLPTPTATPRTSGTPAANTTGTPASASPTPGAAQQGTATPTRTNTPASGGSGGRTYTVVSDDYPLLIAEKLNVPEAQRNAWVTQLLSMNGVDASGLDVGDVLELPANTP